MQVKSLGTYPKMIDGKALGPFTKGHTYELSATVARKLIASSMMEEVKPEPVPEPEPAQEAAGDSTAEPAGD